MKPEELIELYALEEAIDYVIKGLELSKDDALGEVLGKLFHNKVNDNDLSMDEFKTLKEAYKNPPVVKQETKSDVPGVPPWLQYAGQGWKKR